MTVCKFVLGVLLVTMALEIPVEAAARPVMPGLNAPSVGQLHLVRRRRRKKKPPVKKTALTALRQSGGAGK